MTVNEEAPVSTWGFSKVEELRVMELSDSFANYSETPNASQTRPKFSWPKLRSAIEFYEKERLCYLPAGWGRKNPTVEWKEFQARLGLKPTMDNGFGGKEYEIDKKRIRPPRAPVKLSAEARAKRANRIKLPQKIWDESGPLKLGRERKLENLLLPFNAWVRVLENISKPTPKPQHLSAEELLIITTLTEQGKGEFLVTEDGQMVYAPGEGRLTIEAAIILSAYRKPKRIG